MSIMSLWFYQPLEPDYKPHNYSIIKFDIMCEPLQVWSFLNM